MKFGKKILAVKNSSDPEWGPFWPNYKMLKVRIKDIKVDTERGEISPETKPNTSSGSDALSAGRVDPATIQRSAGEVDFFKALHGELRKCADFFTSVEAQYMVRRGRIREGLRQLELELHQRLFYHHPVATATTLLAACLSVYKELIMLENFAIMTHTAFSKILKKHDKRTQFETREQFMRNLVNLQSFARYPKLKQMLQDLEGMYHIIRNVQGTLDATEAQAAATAPSSENYNSASEPRSSEEETVAAGMVEAAAAAGASITTAMASSQVFRSPARHRVSGAHATSLSEIEDAITLTRESRTELNSELQVDSTSSNAHRSTGGLPAASNAPSEVPAGSEPDEGPEGLKRRKRSLSMPEPSTSAMASNNFASLLSAAGLPAAVLQPEAPAAAATAAPVPGAGAGS